MKATRLLWIMLVVILIGMLPAACAPYGATTASGAFVVGNGANGGDTNLHRIIYPGRVVNVDSGENVYYFPLNSRNYIINDGSVKNANGETVGDRSQLISATTQSGVPIKIAARALWTLNQSQDALQQFYNVCFKYKCWSDKDQSGDTNFATEGWNGMLAENFGPAMDAAARIAAYKATDDIWQKHDPEQYQALADNMSAAFADVMRANLGYPQDLFCGSGNSSWSDPNNPGQGEFTCTPVRIVVDSVDRGDTKSDEGTEGVKSLNEKRLENAKTLYGENAPFWLGLQDTIDKCKGSGSTCVFNIGNSGPTINVPVPTTANP